MPSETERAEVVVYREPAFNAGGIGLIFGADKNDHVILNNREYARLYYPSGPHVFFVRSPQADRPYELTLSLAANHTTCLKAMANPSNTAKVLMPIAYHLSNAFLLEQVSCLSDKEIADYSQVQAEYESK